MKLEAESEALAQAERRLGEVQRDLVALGQEETDGAWVVNALRDLPRLWEALTTVNRGRFLRALVARVVADPRTEGVEVHLANLGAQRGEAA